MPRCRLQETAVQKGVEHGLQHVPHFELAKLKRTFNKTIWILVAC